MWNIGWRNRVWSELERPWDLVVIGGGITGAGILREAVRAGLRTLLVEARDFASGTSSRSSKLVHGGLRYLKQGEIKLTVESVRERERLLKEGRGLINQLGFLMPTFRGDWPPAWVLGLGLTVYDLLAWRWNHRHYDADDMRELCPGINGRGLLGGYRYFDAQTDDARLVLRVIREAVRAGGVALNYAPVESLLRKNSGAVCGVALRDQTTGRTAEAQASVVINATGAWADSVRAYVGRPPRLRLLRGSHLIFSARRLALRRAITFMHPLDWRPVFALPWEGVTLFGTTDVDHGQFVETDPVMSEDEIEYLLTALHYAFPALELSPADAQGAFSGVRAVVGTGQSNPSKESREHVLWREAGLLTVTGGKLTTFRLMAHDALRAVRAHLPHHPALDIDQKTPGIPPDVGSQDAPSRLRDDPATLLRLAGRYGADASMMMAAIHSDELESIGDSTALWTELRWAARAEGVVHLEDLLLRRVRLGLLLPQGGHAHVARMRAIAQSELGWDDERWATEAEAYARVWARSYSLPT